MHKLRVGLAVLFVTVACHRVNPVVSLPMNSDRAADGHVVYVKPTPGRTITTALGDAEATELWIADADGKHAKRLAAGTAASDVEHSLAELSSPRFSPDGRRVYFLSRAWVTSDAVHAVDTRTGREWYVAPGNSLDIIKRGPLAGCLLVAQHRYRQERAGTFDWVWVISDDGHDVLVAATDPRAVDRIAQWRSGEIPPDASGDKPLIPSDVHCEHP